jgi:predicted P-loop ATPase/GTPase
MTLLVAGSERVDAGKTTFSTGLVARTGAVGFKPRAGNDRWFHHDDYRRAVESGRLYGKDARRLAAAGPGQLAPEDVNPVHRLWRPTPGRTGLLGQDDRSFVLDRVGDSYLRNGTVDLPPLVREHLPVSEARVVASLAELNEAMADLHLPAMERLRETVAGADRAVVESYADVARPFRGVEPDAVAVCRPRRVRLYRGERYRKACEVAAGGPEEGQLEERVENVLDLVEPEARLDLPALPAETRTDPGAVADAYADAYDRLLSLAGWD